MILVPEYVHIARRSHMLVEISRNNIGRCGFNVRLILVVGDFIYIEFFCRAIRRFLILYDLHYFFCFVFVLANYCFVFVSLLI
jgi:hypothetical protein